jgi:hypothetical protein
VSLRLIKSVALDVVRVVAEDYEFEQLKNERLTAANGWRSFESTPEEREVLGGDLTDAFSQIQKPVDHRKLRCIEAPIFAAHGKLLDERLARDRAAAEKQTARLADEWNKAVAMQQAARQVDQVLTQHLMAILERDWQWDWYSERRQAYEDLWKSARPLLIGELVSGELEPDALRRRLKELARNAYG